MAGNINPDLQKERRNASFEVEKLTNLIDEGEERTQQRRETVRQVLQDSEFQDVREYHYMNRSDKYDNAVRKTVRLFEVANEKDLTAMDPEYRDLIQFGFPNELQPFGLHEIMFSPTLMNQCTPEQQEKWLPMARTHAIVGTYAQTEMGHGTNIRYLETTATYDSKTQEFVINSPTLTSTKWWPGGLGKTSDHVILMAQLITQGRNVGIHPFVVQIRDLNTHRSMPGVDVGDIGPKFGYETNDNGFLRFDNVRIKREQMLMKNSEVLEDGTYISKAANKRVNYLTMVLTRAMIATRMSGALAQAVTIATRYSCVRRQTELVPGAGEVQVMDFQTQQYKVLPFLATSFALMFAGRQVRDSFFSINAEVSEGNMELLPELHAFTSCLKAFATYAAKEGIETCRLACGGHGYSHASGIPKIYCMYVSGCTYEGENTVMYLQTARYLMKAYQQMNSSQTVSGISSYLHIPANSKSLLTSELNLQHVLDAFKFRAARVVERAGVKYNKLLAYQEQHLAWNNTTVDLVEASEAHAYVYVMDAFARAVNDIEDKSLRDVMSQLCQLYGCYNLMKDVSVLSQSGYLSNEQIQMIETGVLRLLADVRVNAVALVDGFEFPDRLLGSALGRYDGNVYDAMYQWAKENPLNQQQVHPSFDAYVKPFRDEMIGSKL